MGSYDDDAAGIYKPPNESSVWPHFLWRNHSASPNCEPIQKYLPERVDLLPLQLIFSVLYLLIWLSAILGNCSVIYVVSLKQVKLSSVRSVFICSLAASDILMSLTSLPITAISIFTRDWVFPSVFCNLIGVFQGGAVFVSSFTLTAIAVDRYILIRHPTSQFINFKTAVGIVVGIWLLGYTLAMPVGIFSRVETYSPFCGLFCDEIWPDTNEFGVSRMRKMYGTFVLIVQFGLPTVISSLCYWRIGQLIRVQIRKRKEHQIMLQDSRDRLQSRKSRSSRMMSAMVMGLVLAWLPMNLINLWRDFDQDTAAESGASEERSPSQWYSLVFAACHTVAMTSAVWNPIIYSFFNPQFKDTLRSAVERSRRQSHAKAEAKCGAGGCAGGGGDWAIVSSTPTSRRPSAAIAKVLQAQNSTNSTNPLLVQNSSNSLLRAKQSLTGNNLGVPL